MVLKKNWIPSPFFSARGNKPIDMLIIHHIGSDNGKIYSISGTISWFTDEKTHLNPTTGKIENPVSAHYIIPREPYKGYDVIQVVKDADIAFHAGDSKWTVQGLERRYINQYSIGIELEGDGNVFEYTEYQYEILIELTKQLMAAHNIPEENILGHEDIAPGRKVDPGKLFDWKKYRQALTPEVITNVAAPAIPVLNNIAPPKVPDEKIYKESGTNNAGKSANFFSYLLSVILRFFNFS